MATRKIKQVEHPSAALRRWKEYYKKEFGITLDIQKINKKEIPDRYVEEKLRLFIVAKGLTIQGVFEKCNDKFGALKDSDTNLDSDIPMNTRDPNRDGTYLLWLRDIAEPSKGLRDFLVGGTLLERLLIELDYFQETGGHLDMGNEATVKNATLCKGSRYANGGIPVVHWARYLVLNDGLFVGCFFIEDYCQMRAREIIARRPKNEDSI